MADLLAFLSCDRLVLEPIGTPVPDGAWSTAAGAADGSSIPLDDPQPCRIHASHPTTSMYDHVVIDGEAFPFVAGRANLRAMLRARFPSPADLARIEAFLAVMEEFAGEPVQQQVTLFFRLKVVGLLPMWLRDALQRLTCRKFLKYAHMTSEGLLRHCGIEPTSKLGMVVLGQYGDAGMRPDKASALIQLGVMLHYEKGSTYPRGGSGAIPRKLNNVIRAAGGSAFVHARVSSLLFHQDSQQGGGGPAAAQSKKAAAPRVRGVRVNGETDVLAKAVVSGIGVGRTYRDLLATASDARAAALAQAPLQRIYGSPADCELSVAFIFLFVGIDITDQPPSERDGRSHNTWIYPDFPNHELDGFTNMEQRIEASQPWSRPMPMFVASGSAKDSTYEARHPNRKTVVVLSQCPWAWVRPWQHLTKKERAADQGYQAFKEQAEAAMMEQGFRKVFPRLEKHVRHTSVGTPLSTNAWLGTDEGECYGLGLTPQHLHLPDLVPGTAVDGLFMTGQDVCTLGVSGAVSAGYITANAVAGYGRWENALLQMDIMVGLGLPPLF
jgi:all-trans-retinol 13,14-reductase